MSADFDGSEGGWTRKRMLPFECSIDTKKQKEEGGGRRREKRGREGRKRAEALNEMSEKGALEISADRMRLK